MSSSHYQSRVVTLMSVVDSQSFHLSRLFLRCGSGVEIGWFLVGQPPRWPSRELCLFFRKIFWMMKRLKLQTKTVVITKETSCKCFLLCSNLCILTCSFSISRFVYVTCGLCGKSLRSMLRLDIPPVFMPWRFFIYFPLPPWDHTFVFPNAAS